MFVSLSKVSQYDVITPSGDGKVTGPSVMG